MLYRFLLSGLQLFSVVSVVDWRIGYLSQFNKTVDFIAFYGIKITKTGIGEIAF
jgi:hypothetical protein